MSFSALLASTVLSMSPIGVAPVEGPAGPYPGVVTAHSDARAVAPEADLRARAQPASGARPVSGPPRLIVRGASIFTPDGTPFRPRGFNWGAKGSAQPQDAADNAKQGANVVRLHLSWYYGSHGNADCGGKQDSYDPNAPGFIDPTSLKYLDKQVRWGAAAHLWIDVMVRGGDCDFWTNDQVKTRYIRMWEYLAQHYKDMAYIASYSLLSEPHPPAGQGNDQVRDLFRRTIRAVRVIDDATPIVIGPAKDYDVRDLEQIYMPGQTNIVYTVNFYELSAYVKQIKKNGEMTGYPGYYLDQGNASDSCNYVGRGQTVFMGPAFLNTLLECATNFRDAHQVPVFVDQIGIRGATPASLHYVRDVLELFKLNNLGFNYWTYRQPYAKDSLLDGGAGILWQDDAGVYHTKALWLSIISSYFQGP
jgi:hypothetical protein